MVEKLLHEVEEVILAVFEDPDPDLKIEPERDRSEPRRNFVGWIFWRPPRYRRPPRIGRKRPADADEKQSSLAEKFNALFSVRFSTFGF